MMRLFGIIGNPLSHSFSPGYFTDKFRREGISATYQAFPLNKVSEFAELVAKHQFSGLNVTIPYKETILPFLDEIDAVAAAVGAVNTIRFENGKKTGYNTDVAGFEQSLLTFGKNISEINGALILGTGGAAKAVAYVLQLRQIPYLLVSSSGKGNVSYDLIDKNMLEKFNLIVNTTPVGMFPNTTNCPSIPYTLLNENNFLYDLIYNPEKTLFLTEGFKRGAKIKNGYDMLLFQAEKAWKIWNQPVM